MKTSKIAIIGGGISGLVIAEQLRAKGYHEITLYEKNHTLGGKIHSVQYAGKSYELGTIFGLPSQERLKALMKRLGIKGDGPKLSRVNYSANGEKTIQLPKSLLSDFRVEMERLPDVLAGYTALNAPRIQYVEPPLMLPFSQWCDYHEFSVLKKVIIHYYTIFGLGELSQIPALFVLRVLNYDNLMTFMEMPDFVTWKGGAITLVQKLGQTVKDIRLGQAATDLKLLENQQWQLTTAYESTLYDQVIIAAPLDEVSHFACFDSTLREMLNQIKVESFNVYAICAENIPSGVGCLLDNLKPERRGHITLFDTRWEVTSKEALVIAYAYDAPDGNPQTTTRLVMEDLEALGVCEPRIYQMKRWRHSPHVDSDQLQNGFFQRIEALQGKNGLFYAGECLSSLSLENCIRFSESLVSDFF